MKFGKVGQVMLVSAIALLVATLFTACGTLTVGFLFVATNKQTPGQIEVYEVNSESGVLRTIPTSPFPSGGRNPIAEVVSPVSENLYVVNEDDSNIVQFGIGTDGKLYPQSTINTPGAFPLATGMSADGNFLYALDTLQPIAGCSLTNPCPGAIAAYAVVSTDTAKNTVGSFGQGALGQACRTIPPATVQTCTLGSTLTYAPLQLSANDQTVLTPTAINVAANGSYVFVSAASTISNQNKGYLFAFHVESDGSLTPVTLGQTYKFNSQDTQMIPLPAGSDPVALASDPSGSFLYVVDKLQNQVATYTVQPGGTLSITSTAATGNQPSGITLASNFLYVSNSLDSTVTGYSTNSGSLTTIGTSASDTNPVAITGDPRKVGFLYTVNFLGSSLSGYQINPTTGELVNTQSAPYVSSVQPTAIAGTPHGGTTTAAK